MLARELENAKLIDDPITNLGLVCMRTGDYPSAVLYLNEHIEIARKNKDVRAEAKDHALHEAYERFGSCVKRRSGWNRMSSE